MLEIKCPVAAQSVEEMAKSPTFCLALKDGELTLKKSHPYYTQVQHHMAIVDRSWCDFVVFAANQECQKDNIAIVRVKRNRSFWSAHYNKLKVFFLSEIVPDVIASAQGLFHDK